MAVPRGEPRRIFLASFRQWDGRADGEFGRCVVVYSGHAASCSLKHSAMDGSCVLECDTGEALHVLDTSMGLRLLHIPCRKPVGFVEGDAKAYTGAVACDDGLIDFPVRPENVDFGSACWGRLQMNAVWSQGGLSLVRVTKQTIRERVLERPIRGGTLMIMVL